MEPTVAFEWVQAVAAVRADEDAGTEQLTAGLRAVTQLRSWLAGCEAAFDRRLAALASFPEKLIAEATRSSLAEAAKATARAETLTTVPAMSDALDRGDVTAGHIDAITRAASGVDAERRAELFARIDRLVDVATASTTDEFRRRLTLEVRSLLADDGMARLECQRRGSRLRSWTDSDGMWCLSGRFDPLTGTSLAARLDAAVQALFAASTPDTAPSDPVERQRHLQALALAHLITGAATGVRPGRPEFVVVIDTAAPDGAGGPTVDWGLPVDIPYRLLCDLAEDGGADVHAVVVRNGVVLHAPGELDLGRTTRLANRAQRRALRALHASCAVPDCAVRFDRCKIHHVVWWRHGGRTDLANLLPLCTHHHTKVHDEGWALTLGADRGLTIRFPDGAVHNTGPPRRRAA